MESKSRLYHLAFSYDNYTRSRSLKATLKPLPYHIKEEQDSQGHMPDTKPQNIFGDTSEARASRIQPKLSQSYQYVGMKEMKSYIARADKKKRHQNTILKRSTQTALSMISLTRASQAKVPQERYLTKEEVLQKITSPNHKSTDHLAVDETYLKNDNSLMKTISPNTTFNSSYPYSFENSHQKTLPKDSKEFSVKKVINRMKNYRDCWENQTAAKKQRGALKRCATTKVTSLLERAEEFRKKVEQQEKNMVAEQIEYIQPKLWDRVLRTSKTLVNLCEKDVEHIVRLGLVSSGKSKFKKQLQWLQDKDRKGLIFRFQKDQKK